MILFLDTISPLPEFSLIEDNKIIFSKRITENSNQKLSDFIVPKYLDLDKKFNFFDKLDKLVILTGPGSYTALRVGISFFYGLSLSRRILLFGVSSENIIDLIIKKKDLHNSAIYLQSANNQRFLCFFSTSLKNYIIEKIEDENIDIIFQRNKIYNILSNFDLSFETIFKKNKYTFKKIYLKKIIEKNIDKVILDKNMNKNIIEPIYVSNNKILS